MDSLKIIIETSGWDDNDCLGDRNTSSIGAWTNSFDGRPPWYCIVSPLLQTNKQIDTFLEEIFFQFLALQQVTNWSKELLLKNGMVEIIARYIHFLQSHISLSKLDCILEKKLSLTMFFPCTAKLVKRGGANLYGTTRIRIF